MTNYYLVIVIMTVMMLVVMMLLIADNKSLSQQNQKGFYFVAILIIVAVISEFLGVLLNGVANTRILHILVKFIELSIAPAIPIICGMAVYQARYKWLPLTIVATNLVLELLSAFFGFIYFVDLNNFYHHSSFYWFYYLAYSFGTIYLLVHVYLFSSKYQNQKNLSLTMIMLFIFNGIFIQAIYSSLRIVWLSVAIGFSLFYIYYGDLILRVDMLTGLLNRGAYDQKIENLRGNITFLFFDIDRFKLINDNHGHSTGDECLRKVAAEIRHTFGHIGLCYRYGGDEFCVITNHQVNNIEEYISAFLQNLDVTRKTTYADLPYVSIGYANYQPGNQISEVVSEADKMMYEYKHIHHLEL